MKNLIKVVLLYLLVLPVTTVGQGINEQVTKTDPAVLAKLKAAVEASPDSLNIHQAYIKAVGLSPGVAEQYKQWMKRFPHSAIVPYAIGKAYNDRENPDARPFLLAALKIDPKLSQAWAGLRADALMRGNSDEAFEFLKKAMEYDPSNAQYAYAYADHFHDKDIMKYRELMSGVAKRFPSDQLGAAALYWLAKSYKDNQDEIKVYELLKKTFPPEKFNWSQSGMSDFYNILMEADPGHAVALSQEMINLNGGDDRSWMKKLKDAQSLIAAKNLIGQSKGKEAFALLTSIKYPTYYSFYGQLLLLKAEAIAATDGGTKAAYDSLIVYFVKTPMVKLKDVISTYGAKLGKDSEQIDRDILKIVDGIAQPATPFTLKNYFTKDVTSLSDYRGKVVLLTYWFPGCGPCAAEFPHFENVLKKFKGRDIIYIGINEVSEQNEFVLPLIKEKKYTFIPLEDVKGRIKGNLDNGYASPVNFLIDADGRLVFSKFSTGEDNEDDLELMIRFLLDQKTNK